MIRDIYSGFIKVHILYHATKEPVYGLWLIEELGHHGYNLGPGTLYPTLRKLEQQGLLRVSKINVAGKMRKYYSATSKGKALLVEAKKHIAALAEEVIEESS